MKFKIIFVFILIFTGIKLTYSQTGLDKKVMAALQKKDDSLKMYSKFMDLGGKDTVRAVADSIFTKILVRALITPNSYQFKFDSAINISKVEAPDKSFRILTWQLMLNENFYIQRGVIQINTADGKPKLFPLFDRSQLLKNITDSLLPSNSWVGAVYYKILAKTINGKANYILMGLDRNNAKTDKKWIDVLTFDDNGKPQFGAQIFSFKNDTTNIKSANPFRYFIEYKKEAKVRLNFDEEMNLIVYDHLESEENTIKDFSTYIPTGNYEAFNFIDDKLLHIPNLFTYKAQVGDIPQGSLLDDDNFTELDKANEKNKLKEKQNLANKKKSAKNPK